MKKLIIFAIALASLTSCAKFLDVKPEGIPTNDNYFQSDYQINNAIKSIYSPMADGDDCFGRNTVWVECLGTQMVVGRNSGDWSKELTTLKWNGDEFGLRNPFEWYYKFIERSNWIVDALLKQVNANDAAGKESSYVLKRALGEAYFLRAFFHLQVANWYGRDDDMGKGVPFVRYEDFPNGYDNSIPTQQEHVSDNYRMIIEDLDNALKYLPYLSEYVKDHPEDLGRPQKQAAMAMKARAYAYWANWKPEHWDDVITCVNALEGGEFTAGEFRGEFKDSDKRALVADFNELFTDEISKWWNSEYCWSIPSNGGFNDRVGAEFPGLTLENKGYGVYNGWGNFKATNDAYEEFKKDGDDNTRMKRSILKYGQEWTYAGNQMKYYSSADIETGFGINKWLEPFKHPDFINAGYVNEAGGSWVSARVNYHIIRFADCLLLRAEAKIMKGGNGDADINTVRGRADLSPKNGCNMAEIYHERYCELAYEPMASHATDLRRWMHSDSKGGAKALAKVELESHPQALYHVWRDWPESPEGRGIKDDGTLKALGPVMNPTIDGKGLESTRKGLNYTEIDDTEKGKIGDYQNYQGEKGTWDDHLAAYPYPSKQITNSAGRLQQNGGYSKSNE